MEASNIIGVGFGRLTVLKEAGRATNKVILFLCVCVCGNVHP